LIIRRPTLLELRMLRAIANYQFRTNIGNELIPSDVYVKVSKSTGKIREVLTNNRGLLLVLRASDYMFNLTKLSAIRLHKLLKPPKNRVIVVNEVSEFIREGRNVFARHVIAIDEDLRANDEVIVVNEDDELLGYGRLKLSPLETMFFTRGLAVLVRGGVKNGNG